MKYLILIIGIIFTTNVFASTISDCALLLPDNHHYKVVVKYDFVKGKVKRLLSIKDKSVKKLTKLQSEKIKPFVDCIKNNV